MSSAVGRTGLIEYKVLGRLWNPIERYIMTFIYFTFYDLVL